MGDAMSNQLKGEIEISLDKRRTLRFTSNSLVRLEGVLGYSYKKILKRIRTGAEIAIKHGMIPGAEDEADIKTILAVNEESLEKDVELNAAELRAMLWAGLLHEDPELTLEQAGDLMDEGPEDMGSEDYIAIYVITAFLLRFAPGNQATKIRKQAKSVKDLLEQRLTGETMSASAGLPSGAGLKSNGSGK
jgi:hypothetical protein